MVNQPPTPPSDSEPAKPRIPKIVVRLSSVAKRAPSAFRKATRILAPAPLLEPPPLPRPAPVQNLAPVVAPMQLPELPATVIKLPLPAQVPEKKPVMLAPPKAVTVDRSAKSIFDEVPAGQAEEPATPIGWKSLEAGELPLELSELDPFAKFTVDDPKEEVVVVEPVLLPVIEEPPLKTVQLKLPEVVPPQPPLQPLTRPVLPREVKADLFLQPPPEAVPPPAEVKVPPFRTVPVPALLPLKKEVSPKKSLGNLFSKTKTVPPLESPGVEAKAAPVVPSAEKKTLLPAPTAPGQKNHKAPKKLELSTVKQQLPVLPVKNVETSLKPKGLPSLKKADSTGQEVLLLPKTASELEDTAEKRASRIRRKHLTETAVFYGVTLAICVGLYYGSMSWFPETRVEGQVIPPPGMTLSNEAWIVQDFSSLALGVSDDLAGERAPQLQEIAERRDALQRVRADIAGREERISLLQQQIQSAHDEITQVVKDAHDQVQAIWDGAGVQLEKAYDVQLAAVEKTIKDRAAQLKLTYHPNEEYRSPEVWANAYRLALYQPPAGVDAVKEHAWIEDQLKKWRDFTKSLDDQQKQLRDQAAQIQASPSAKVDDLKAQIDELQHKVDDATTDELPLKRELEEDQSSLGNILAEESGLDGKYYQQLSTLPQSSIIAQLRFPISNQGRFSWKHVEKDAAFTPEKKERHYFIFLRAMRADGREFWCLQPFTVQEGVRTELTFQPGSFLSTQAILRPDLPADEP